MSLSAILEHAGLAEFSAKAVHGGDINQAYRLQAGGQCYFLKLNDAARFPGMFEKEAAGLVALKQSFPLKVPAVVHRGETEGNQYLLLEWLDAGRKEQHTMEQFGHALAQLHHHTAPGFGWSTDNYIGSLVQRNTEHADWASFYAGCRIMPLVKRLLENGSLTNDDVRAAEVLCQKLADYFPVEPPALLHGDLWSGNYMVTENGEVAIFDPAVYFGHREMDIGMSLLFGGFDADFYAAYDDAYPLIAGWRERVPLTQLYPLLVHAVLFGAHYISHVKSLINRFDN